MANSLMTRGAALPVLTAVTLLLLQGPPAGAADPQVAGAASQLTAAPLFSAAAVKAATVLSMLGLAGFAVSFLAFRESLVVMTTSMLIGGLIMLHLMT